MRNANRWQPRTRLKPAVLAAALLLAGCAGTGEPATPCCYQGELTRARAVDVYLALAGGGKLSLAEALPGIGAGDVGPLGPQLPFSSAEIALVTLGSLKPVLPRYDANGDGFIQEPELTVMYIREAAIGLGHEVDHVGVNPRADAIVLPESETRGLARFVDRNLFRMTRGAQAIFRDLVFLGQQIMIETTIVRDTMD